MEDIWYLKTFFEKSKAESQKPIIFGRKKLRAHNKFEKLKAENKSFIFKVGSLKAEAI